jgi:hypothetical protein
MPLEAPLVRVLILALCGWCLVLAQAAVNHDSNQRMLGRHLLQAATCTRIPNCSQCSNAKDDNGVTVLVCRGCVSGYKPSLEGTACGRHLLVALAQLMQRECGG